MTHRDIKTDEVRMESYLAETLKSVIMVLVTLSIIISSLVTLWLLRKSKTNTDDFTAPLVTSVFTSGLVVGFLCLLACLIKWFNLQQHLFVLHLYIYLLVLGFYMNFIFVATLTSLKLLAILKPFLYKRTVTFKILKNITFIIWGATMCIISPLMAWFSLPRYNAVTKTVQMTGKYSLVFSKVIFLFDLYDSNSYKCVFFHSGGQAQNQDEKTGTTSDCRWNSTTTNTCCVVSYLGIQRNSYSFNYSYCFKFTILYHVGNAATYDKCCLFCNMGHSEHIYLGCYRICRPIVYYKPKKAAL